MITMFSLKENQLHGLEVFALLIYTWMKVVSSASVPSCNAKESVLREKLTGRRVSDKTSNKNPKGTSFVII